MEKILGKIKDFTRDDSQPTHPEGLLDHFRVGTAARDLGPLVVFINPKAGGNQGVQVMEEFMRLFEPCQVFDLTVDGGPLKGLQAWSRNQRFEPCRILACGGDGTPGWVMSAMDQLGYANEPPVAILPLGTGNDISRVLGWGPGYKGQPLEDILAAVYAAHAIPFDRWMCKVGSAPPKPLNNYFTLGVDTDILLRFHQAREKHPEKFTNREKNKLHYIKYSMSEFMDDVQKKNTPLSACCHVEADGNVVSLPSEALGLMVLNIQSYGGGADMWGKPAGFRPQSFSDKLLEVGYVKGTKHMAEIQSGISHAVPLVQCSRIKIAVRQDMSMQVDGEPWLQKCEGAETLVEITFHKQNRMFQYAVAKIR